MRLVAALLFVGAAAAFKPQPRRHRVMVTTGYGFQAKEEQTKRTAALAAHVAKSWSGPGPAPSVDALAALRITVITAICALPETTRTRVIESHPTSVVQKWHCCRGDIFKDPKWRKMIICIFIVLQPAFFVPMAFKTVLVLFGPELRLLRKALHMVAPHREHSFGFMQATEFIKECEIQYGMYTASDHTICGPFVPYGQLFVTLGLLREVDGLISHDGWLICAVNSLHDLLGGLDWCFWGADSQGKQVFLTGLLDSYVAVYDLASPLLASCPITAGQPLPVIPPGVLRQLRELVEGQRAADIWDAGYPDAEIVAARERNHQAIAAQREVDRAVFQLAGYPM